MLPTRVPTNQEDSLSHPEELPEGVGQDCEAVRWVVERAITCSFYCFVIENFVLFHLAKSQLTIDLTEKTN